MRKLIIIYCGEDGTAGKFEATNRRDDETNVFMASASDFQPPGEACDLAVIMPDVPSFHRDRIKTAYGRVEVLKATQQECESVGAAPAELAAVIAAPPIKRGRGRPRKMAALPPLVGNEPYIQGEGL